MDDVK